MEKESEILEGVLEETNQSVAKIESSNDLVLGAEKAHDRLMLRAKGLEALRTATIKALKPSDFHEFGSQGKGYWLESSGVSKVSSIYGIDYSKPVFTKEWKDWYDEEKDVILEKHYYIIKCDIEAYFRMDNRKYQGSGSASTRDPFFMRDSKIPHPLNVDEEDVRKKSETNARARCLMGLGLANFTKEEIVGAGMKTGDISGHEYKSDLPKGSVTDKQWGLLDKLVREKMIDINPDDLMDTFRSSKQGLVGKQVSYLIEWFMTQEKETVEYDNHLKPIYKDILAGKYHKEEKK
jgi:hypothetical protein